MKRIINTFKYGSKETKGLLAVTFLAGLIAVGLVITALVMHSLLFFFGAIICAFVTISLAQTFGIREDGSEGLAANIIETGKHDSIVEVKEIKKIEDAEAEETEGIEPLRVEEVEKKIKVKATKFEKLKMAKKIDRSKRPDKQPKPKKTKASKTVVKAAKQRKEKRKKAVKYVMQQQAQKTKEQKLDRMKSKKKEQPSVHEKAKEEQQESSVKKNDTKVMNQEQTVDNSYGLFGDTNENEGLVGDGISATADLLGMSGFTDTTASEEQDSKELSEEEKQEQLQSMQASDEEIAQYNRKKVKKMLRKYKVKREHRLVLIDKCEKHSIYQTPAYIWVADNLLHLLLIEKEPRHLTLPTFNIHEITYLKKQIANEDIDYAAFKGKSMLAELFRPYLPDYAHSTVVDDLSAYKNLYGIGPGIYFTNRSASSLLDLLAVDFAVEDKVTTSTKVNVYFKDAYKSNILLRDNVIDANGYADRISSILDSMAHSTISYSEFKETLNLMQKNKLITAEFAMYYMGVRDKI